MPTFFLSRSIRYLKSYNHLKFVIFTSLKKIIFFFEFSSIVEAVDNIIENRTNNFN